MSVTYDIMIRDPFNGLLTPLGGGAAAGDPNAVSSFSYSRVVNDIGVAVLTYPGELRRELLRLDNVIYIYRTVNGLRTLVTDTAWLLRKIRRVIDNRGQTWTELTAYSANYLLSARGIAYQSTSAESAKTGAADDVIKAYVRENIGPLVTDAARQLGQVVVEEDETLGATVDMVAGWRDNLLTVCQEVAEASATAGTYVAFDMVASTNSTWTFATYTGQRGIDRRFPNGASPLLLGPDYGNIADIEYVVDWTDAATFAYALGQGLGTRRKYQTASDDRRISESPYGRKEVYVEAGNATTTAQLTSAAQAAVRAGRPKQTFKARIIETPATRYGVHWNWGDFVTVTAFGQTINARIDAVSVTVEQGQETVDAWVRSE